MGLINRIYIDANGLLREDAEDYSVEDLEHHRLVWEEWWSTCLACGSVALAVVHLEAPGFLQCAKCGELRLIRTVPGPESKTA